MKKYVLPLVVFLPLFYVAQERRMQSPFVDLVDNNPSLAGSSSGLRAQLWAGSHGTGYFNNQAGFCADYLIPAISGGVAVSHDYEESADQLFQYQKTSITYAQQIRLCSKLKITPSFVATLLNNQVDLDRLRFGMIINQVYPTERKSNWSASAGLLGTFSDKLYVGIYYFDFNRPDIGLFGTQPMFATWQANISYNWTISEKFALHLLGSQSVSPLARGSHVGGGLFSAQSVIFQKWIAGVSLLNLEHPGFTAGYHIRQLTATLRYMPAIDWTSTTLSAALSVRFINNEKAKTLTSLETW